MSYLMSNRTSLTILLSPHLMVNGHSPYKELKPGCWAKFHKQPWDTVTPQPHVRLSIRQERENGEAEFTGRFVRGSHTPEGLWRAQFGHKIAELRSMPIFGQSLSDTAPIRVAKGVWIFPLPIIRR